MRQLLDTAAVAEMLGVKPATVHQYRHRGTFPAPDATFAGRPGWYATTIREWAATRPGQDWRKGRTRS